MSEKKLKIFVSAYACEPNLGSEIGVGWHWVLEMSKRFELWVLTRESNRKNIEAWIAEHSEFSNINFIYFDLPKWARFWKKGLRGVRLYYNIWQACTNKIVKQVMFQNDIKIFHHLTYGNALWNVSSYGQKQFFIWGPIGGLETISSEFSSQYSEKWKLIEFTRRIAIRLLPLNFSFKKRCKNADLILCKTDITRNLIPLQYRNKAVLQTDVAVENYCEQPQTDERNSKKISIITVGRLDAWRGFDLCVESFAKASKINPQIHLTIVGKGSDEIRLKKLARELNVFDKITFTGQVSTDEYKRLLADSDVVLNASLKEGAVTVSFDSMSLGKPLICLDTTGYTRYFSNDYAVLIPITNRTQVLDDLKNGIIKLCDSATREEMGKRAKEAGTQFTWASRGEEIAKLFLERTRDICQ